NIARDWLRPTYARDVSVDIAEMAQYVNEEFGGVRSVWRMGGNWTTIRQLVASGFPVIIETSVQVTGQGSGWAGHNRLIIGYDGNDILTFDSYLGNGSGNGLRYPQEEIDELWRQMNRNFMVIYPIERENEVAYIIGEDWNIANNIDHAHRVALAEMRANPSNIFAGFNLGTTYIALGQYEEAVTAYDAAFEAGRNTRGGIPFRIFWYQFGVFDAYYHVGRYDEVIYQARAALENMAGNGAEEVYYWLGMGYAGRGEFDRAKAQFENALAFNPRYKPAEDALQQIITGTYKPPVVMSN
ncbi:MAG TPA: tetratricopeptide repeat protein, partial [Aggregatilineales bacterium]|nr:tetratricopeptide repeat protein [Aggregatilineales bacterium]